MEQPRNEVDALKRELKGAIGQGRAHRADEIMAQLAARGEKMDAPARKSAERRTKPKAG